MTSAAAAMQSISPRPGGAPVTDRAVWLVEAGSDGQIGGSEHPPAPADPAAAAQAAVRPLTTPIDPAGQAEDEDEDEEGWTRLPRARTSLFPDAPAGLLSARRSFFPTVRPGFPDASGGPACPEPEVDLDGRSLTLSKPSLWSPINTAIGEG